MTYTKGDVRVHNDGRPYGGPIYPAVNVKSYHFPTAEAIADRFGCSGATALRAGGYAWECHVESFWDHAQDDTENVFGPGVKVYSVGRSGGWAIVEGLPPLGSWDAIMLGKWRQFEQYLEADREGLCSESAVFDTIHANGWAIDDKAIAGVLEAAAL